MNALELILYGQVSNGLEQLLVQIDEGTDQDQGKIKGYIDELDNFFTPFVHHQEILNKLKNLVKKRINMHKERNEEL